MRLSPLPRVAGDSSALFRVFVNLLQNAMKDHRPTTPPVIAVTEEMGEGWVVASVVDDGIAITPSDRVPVFDKRYRVPAGVTQSDGDGLGLATTHRLVAGMGVTIWVDGRVERGTAIRIPLV
ncbi:MAG: ATP-binding protein [Chloroflexi bacterium]|nr:ATP-binding protein [Chloroflexota bacterium]